MRRAMLIAMGIVAVAVAAVLIFAATKPDTLQIERSMTIDAPPLKVFALVNDFHNWPRWQPQDREDPSVVRTYSGAGSGLGAMSEWHGKSSAGRQAITASSAPSEIVVKVDFAKPFQAHNINTFSFAQSGSGTTVTWTMRGTNVYPAKVMSVFVNMGAMMGRHFEEGLRNLKAESEK